MAGQQLFVSISGLNTNHLGLNFLVRQLGHPVDSALVHRFKPDEDVTGDCSTGLGAAILSIFPPSSGYPIRFWQLVIIAQWLPGIEAPPAPLPTISIQGGIY
ncbi:MAG: hypothetical protein Q8P18_33180 [Pseudomonadota bacterium]|nr:hypothetical protein [Pseudomonadota bacterium]